MSTQHTNALSILTGTVLCLGSLPLGCMDAGQLPTRSTGEGYRSQLAIAHTIPGLQAFCLRRQQAEMLAEQTADFGTLGLLITAAAMGIDPLQANRVAWRQERAFDLAQGLNLSSAAHTGPGRRIPRQAKNPV